VRGSASLVGEGTALAVDFRHSTMLLWSLRSSLSSGSFDGLVCTRVESLELSFLLSST
jgi:hypothetical protein